MAQNRAGIFTSAARWQRKKVILLAPDAIVFINGNTEGPICLNCRNITDFKDDIVSVSVSNTIDGQIPTASISIRAPRHSKKNYYKNGRLIFSLMQEVEIAFKGRFLTVGDDPCNSDSNTVSNDTEEIEITPASPKYYTNFWGFISDISEDYSSGEHNIEISCAGMLKWWEIMQCNLHPTDFQLQIDPKLNKDLFMRYFANRNPYQMIQNLGESIGRDLMLPTEAAGFLDASSGFRSEQIQKGLQISALELQAYWQARFKEFTQALKIFGWNGQVKNVDSSATTSPDNSGQHGDQNIKNILLDPCEIENWHPFLSDSITNSLIPQNDSYLSMANAIRDLIGYEFFQDTTGEIVFKPPFYNLDVRPSEPVYVIDDADVISWSFSETESEVVTYLGVFGNWVNATLNVEQPSSFGWFIDYNLARQYGFRAQTRTLPYLNDAYQCHLYAVSELSRINAMRFVGNITMAGRPELRLGYPVYIKSRDQFWYVTSIQHTFQFGGSFTTTVGLAAQRRKHLGPQDPQTKEYPGVTSTGEIIGWPNSALVRTGEPPVVSTDPEKPESNTTQLKPDEKQIFNFRVKSGAYFGNQQGIYTEMQITSDSAKEAGNKAGCVIGGDHGVTRVTQYAIPVSDACGYEHLGGWEFGRGLQLLATGEIEPRESCPGEDASTAAQSAITMAPQGRIETPNRNRLTQSLSCAKTLKDINTISVLSKAAEEGASIDITQNPNFTSSSAIGMTLYSSAGAEKGCSCQLQFNDSLNKLMQESSQAVLTYQKDNQVVADALSGKTKP